MDMKELIELVYKAQEELADYYRLAAIIMDAQKEADAKLAENMGATSVASAIRNTL
jgi:hypothetical protein